MTSYEPASGRNLPPGCRDEDIDREFGRVPTCGDCRHLLEGCCDACEDVANIMESVMMKNS